MSEQNKEKIPVIQDIVSVKAQPTAPKEFNPALSIELRITETQQKLTEICNSSQLTPGVLALILANLFNQVNDIAKAQVNIALEQMKKQKEANNGNTDEAGK